MQESDVTDDWVEKAMALNQLALSSITKPDYLADALLRKQYFPFVKGAGEELPPFFTSETFSDALASSLNVLLPRKDFCPVEFRTRRYDGLVRIMGLPHPVPYARLTLLIKDHWIDLLPKLMSKASMIRPTFHDDGRIIIMDYESSITKASSTTKAAQGKQYIVKTDISNCFPSIYTHAVDWALRTKHVAKAQRNRGWEHKLDRMLGGINDGETKGLLIGPAVSNIVSELILQRIDKNMQASGFSFVRYVDDYTAFFRERPEAEAFVSLLESELSEYRLHLNAKKTRIKSIRHGIGENWINDINAYLPRSRSAFSLIRFLQQSEVLAADNPDRSVIRYATKTALSRRRQRKAPNRGDILVIDELLRISFFHPEILCFTVRHIKWSMKILGSEEKTRFAKQLVGQMEQAIRRLESDSMLWTVYGLQILRRTGLITVSLVDSLVSTGDDLVWTALASVSLVARRQVLTAAAGIDKDDHEAREHHWLTRYELYRVGDLVDADIHDEEKIWFRVASQFGLALSLLK